MIDTWLFAACCLALLTCGALVRVFRTRQRPDRLLAAFIAITLGSAAGLSVSIFMGTILVLDLTIILALLCFAGVIAIAEFTGGTGV